MAIQVNGVREVRKWIAKVTYQFNLRNVAYKCKRSKKM